MVRPPTETQEFTTNHIDVAWCSVNIVYSPWEETRQEPQFWLQSMVSLLWSKAKLGLNWNRMLGNTLDEFSLKENGRNITVNPNGFFLIWAHHLQHARLQFFKAMPCFYQFLEGNEETYLRAQNGWSDQQLENSNLQKANFCHFILLVSNCFGFILCFGHGGSRWLLVWPLQAKCDASVDRHENAEGHEHRYHDCGRSLQGSIRDSS